MTLATLPGGVGHLAGALEPLASLVHVFALHPVNTRSPRVVPTLVALAEEDLKRR